MSESIFKNSLRAFFVSLSAAIGLLVGLTLVCFAFFALISRTEQESFGTSVKIMPDAHFSRKQLPMTTPVLLQINVTGTVGSEDLKASKFENMLLKSREDDFKDGRVKGIVLVINSPGGDANDSDIIYRLLKSYKERFHLPIYAYVNGMAASGSYYIACASDKIYASDVSLIGSIGVVSWPPFINVVDLLQKLGVITKTLSAGLGKDQMNPFRPWKPDEEKSHQNILDFYYDNFVRVVCTNRPHLMREKLIDSYGARVYPAPLAKEYGYIDVEHASLPQVLTELAAACGLKEDEKYQVVAIESKDWFKKLFYENASIKFSLPQLFGPIQYKYE